MSTTRHAETESSGVMQAAILYNQQLAVLYSSMEPEASWQEQQPKRRLEGLTGAAQLDCCKSQNEFGYKQQLH